MESSKSTAQPCRWNERKETFIKYSAHKQQTKLSWERAYTFKQKYISWTKWKTVTWPSRALAHLKRSNPLSDRQWQQFSKGMLPSHSDLGQNSRQPFWVSICSLQTSESWNRENAGNETFVFLVSGNRDANCQHTSEMATPITEVCNQQSYYSMWSDTYAPLNKQVFESALRNVVTFTYLVIKFIQPNHFNVLL